MEIKLARNIGFCDGVNRSIEETNLLLDKEKNIYCLGNLVHNDNVINNLKEKGLIITDDVPNTNKLIIRAHGIPKNVYDEVSKKGIELIDLTCPKVLGIHKIAEKLSHENKYILLIGNKKHPEVIGTISFCGKDSSIIENKDDLDNLIINNSEIAIIGQTTFSLSKFNELCNLIKEKFPNKEIKILNTLCDATKKRQEEAEILANEVDIMLIIGDKKSSNTTKLFEVASKVNKQTYLIDNLEDMKKQNINFKKNNSVGIITGASTPKSFALDIKDYLINTKC